MLQELLEESFGLDAAAQIAVVLQELVLGDWGEGVDLAPVADEFVKRLLFSLLSFNDLTFIRRRKIIKKLEIGEKGTDMTEFYLFKLDIAYVRVLCGVVQLSEVFESDLPLEFLCQELVNLDDFLDPVGLSGGLIIK